MSLHRLNPAIPLIESLPGGMNSGSQLTVAGSTHLNSDRFSINFQCGPNVSPRRDDVALHVSLDFGRRVVVRNSIQNMNWGIEEAYGDMPVFPGQSFNIIITSDASLFTIQVNQNVFRFQHRLPPQRITHLTIDGSAMVNEIRFNSSNSMPGGAYPYAGAPGYPTSGAPPYPAAAVPPYPGTAVPPYPGGAYSSQGGYPNNGVQSNQNQGLMSKLGMGVGGSVVGAALASKLGGKKLMKNNKKMAKKAMKYGIPLAGVGVGAYALKHALGGHHHHGLHFGHHGSSSSSSSSSSDSD